MLAFVLRPCFVLCDTSMCSVLCFCFSQMETFTIFGITQEGIVRFQRFLVKIVGLGELDTTMYSIV